jgi:hypothetical protein
VILVILYLSAIVTSLACTVVLFREYSRLRLRLLLWSALCFIGLTLNNVLLFLDLVIFPTFDLRIIRLATALAGMCFLLYGFIWDAD